MKLFFAPLQIFHIDRLQVDSPKLETFEMRYVLEYFVFQKDEWLDNRVKSYEKFQHY